MLPYFFCSHSLDKSKIPMKLNHKDKSLLLFIIAVLVVLWGIFSFFSSIFFAATFGASDVKKLEVQEVTKWFSTSRPLEISDFKNRIILLDFWTYSCVSCIQALPEIKKLEEQYGSKITVIGVHSGKFENDRDPEAIKKAILRYDISHPVINDSDLKIWNSFEVTALPTFVLINPHGNVVQTYVGENEVGKIKADIKKLISKYKFQLNRDPLPLALEKFDVIGNVLSFPSKLEYAADFTYKSRQLPVIFISNTGQNNIVVTSLSGDMVVKIGSGQKGLEDGTFDVASFNAPRGMIYHGGKLYVADSGNNALREIDFKEGRVTTLVGSGLRGDVVEDKGFSDAKDVELSSPSDVEFFPQGSHENIVIANSGTHQILSYNLKKQTISVLAGNGSEGSSDGKYPDNSLAQTSDIAVFGHKLYFVDATSSALRVLDESGEVKTLIGGDLTKSGHANGDKDKALMQHPLGLLVDDTGAYISDSYNHSIRKYDFASMQIHDMAGAKRRGTNLGAFDEPEGIVAILNNFYVADSNNNRILIVNRGTLNFELLDVMPPLKLPKEGFLQYLPNLQKSEDITVADGAEILLKIDLKAGWKINEEGPSFVNLLELAKDDQANLVANFDWHAVKDKEMKLPKLIAGKNYVLQGSIYYCESKTNSLCYIKSYEQKLAVESGEKNNQIVIKLAY